MDENRRIIISILRKQNETKALLRQNSFSFGGHDQDMGQVNELQSRIKELQNDIDRTKDAYSNVCERRVVDFLKLVNVIVKSLRSERTNPSESGALAVVLQTNEFMKLVLQMTHNPHMDLSLMNSLTSLTLELSLSHEGRVKIFRSHLYEFLVRLIQRQDVFKYPAILYRAFNTILNSIQYEPTKQALNRTNIILKLKFWENIVQKDPKLRSKYFVLMKELSKISNNNNGGGNGGGGGGGFTSGFVAGNKRPHNHFGQKRQTTTHPIPPPMMMMNNKKMTPLLKPNRMIRQPPPMNTSNSGPMLFNNNTPSRRMVPHNNNHNNHNNNNNNNNRSNMRMMKMMASPPLPSHHHHHHNNNGGGGFRKFVPQQQTSTIKPPMNTMFTSPQVRHNNNYNPRLRRITPSPQTTTQSNNNGRGGGGYNNNNNNFNHKFQQ